tara:strand:- start:443 stop:574 length:132 start_codon:yes stop_codon:yes gene_type:complete
MLNQESGKSSLNKAVLIPVRAALNERNHGLLQGLRKFGLKAHC